jgi:hypothetical protein
MKIASKTPYEIRLELLQLAFSILRDQNLASSGGEKLLSSSTTEQIIAEADKLNVFVSKACSVQHQ